MHTHRVVYLYTHYGHAHIQTCAHFNECTMISSVVVVGVLLQSINCLHRLLSILIAHKRRKTALKTTTIQLNMLFERKGIFPFIPAQVNVNLELTVLVINIASQLEVFGRRVHLKELTLVRC